MKYAHETLERCENTGSWTTRLPVSGKCLPLAEVTVEQARTVCMFPCLYITPTHPELSLLTVYPVAGFIFAQALPLLGFLYLCLVFASTG